MGGCWHLCVRLEYKWGDSSEERHSSSRCTWSNNFLRRELLQLFETTDRMQVPNRPVGPYGYPVRNYAPASLYPHYQGSQCASPSKPPSGKSFTIDALLAKPEDTSSSRTPLSPAAPVLPLSGHVGLPIATSPYVYSPNMLHSALHQQPGYSVYCCPPFSYQSSCRGAFYAQGK